MTVACDGIESFRMIKFSKKCYCNLLRLNNNHKEYSTTFIVQQSKDQVLATVIIVDIRKTVRVIVAYIKAYFAWEVIFSQVYSDLLLVRLTAHRFNP